MRIVLLIVSTCCWRSAPVTTSACESAYNHICLLIMISAYMASSKEIPLFVSFFRIFLEIFVNFYVRLLTKIYLSQIFTKVYSMEDALILGGAVVWRRPGIGSHRFAPSFRNFSCMTFRNINQLVSKCFHNVPPSCIVALKMFSNPNQAHLSTEPEAWISTWIF